MPDDRHADRAGAELAGEVLPDGRHALLAFLVPAEEGGAAVELGAWAVTGAGKLVRPDRPLVFPVGEVDRVRALAERAAAALPHARPDEEDGAAVLARAGGLAATAAPGPEGAGWVALGRADGGGRAALPAAAAAVLVRVLAEAERALAELGLVPLPGPPRD